MKIICTVLFFLLCQPSFSQFNDSIQYYVNYASVGVINKTNTGNSYILNNNFRFSISKKNYSANTVNSWIYGKQADLITNNDFSSATDFNVFRTDSKLYYWGLGNFDKSVSLKINHRLQTGLGVGYTILNKPKTNVVVSDGILYEKGDVFAGAELGNDRYETIRNSIRLKFKFIIQDVLTVEGSDFYQPSLLTGNDYVVKSNTNLSFRLKKWLSLTTSLTYNKFSRTRSENLLINYGITVERYF